MLETFSILFECAIVVVALLLAKKHKKTYGYTLALTYGLYVVFDAARRFQLEISAELLDLLFFVATISAFYSGTYHFGYNGWWATITIVDPFAGAEVF